VIGTDFDYLRPASVSEALDMASRHEDARFLAGGHALLPEWKLGRTCPPTLIDLSRIAELRGIEVLSNSGPAQAGGGAGAVVRIAAMTTSAEIEYSSDIAHHAPLLAEAAAVISDPLIRNRATLGGSLAEASPGSDWPPVVLVADATVHLRSRGGERAVAARDFFTRESAGTGGGSTALRPGELLTSITVPAAGGRTRSTYLKRMHPASGHAMIGVAVAATFDTGGTCRDCRIAITGTATAAMRALRAEAELAGSVMSPGSIEASAQAARGDIAFTGDEFGSAAYLAELLPIYVSRALSHLATPSTGA
jgi:aerobic carbon-monoxide dehydrogenase medium subunit